jgi:cyclase
VKRVVNTHYHYDHTAGNVLYQEAAIFAHENVPDLMLSQDNEFNSRKWWENNRGGVPTERLDGRYHRMMVGDQEVVLTHPGRAHTSGDLVLYLPQHNIIVTGDLVFNGHYPFLDRGEGGVSVAGLIEAIRRLAEGYPEAIFLPGHGPLARAHDLRRHADYLEFLQASVKRALSDGLSEDQAAERIDLSGWDLSILLSFHGGKLSWVTAKNNVRWAYRILKKDKGRG